MANQALNKERFPQSWSRVPFMTWHCLLGKTGVGRSEEKIVDVKSNDSGLSVGLVTCYSWGPEQLNILSPCFVSCHVGIYYSYGIGLLERSNEKKMHHHKLEKIPPPLKKQNKNKRKIKQTPSPKKQTAHKAIKSFEVGCILHLTSSLIKHFPHKRVV